MGPWVHKLPRVTRHIPTLVLFGIFWWLFGPSFLEHLHNGMDPLRFHDDARIQIWPYYKYMEPGAWTNDYIGDYSRALIPIGHAALFSTLGHFFWADSVGKVVGYLCYVFTLGVVAFTARRLAHRSAALIAAAVMVGSSLLMERVTSGMPRAFAFPVMALALYWTVEGRVIKLAILVVVGAIFYPVAGMTTGAILATLLLVMPARDRGDAGGWSFKKRVIVLAITVFASSIALAPTMIASRAYGARVLDSEHAEFPEAGELGTHGSEDRAPYPSLLEEMYTALSRTYVGEGTQLYRPLRDLVYPWEKVVGDAALVLAVLGVVLAMRKRDEVRRLIPYIGGMSIAHLVARALAPYLYAPNRYVVYAIIPFFAVILPVGMDALFRGPSDASKRPWLRRALAVVLCALVLGMVGGRGSTTRGLTIQITPDDAKLYKFIGELPESAMIAGWPDDPMSNVPYVSKRRALMTGEMHIGFHKGYLMEIRRKLTLFFNAYFASSTEPIFKLRDELGVTHMFVELRHFQGNAPGYMPPLGAIAKAAADTNRNAGFELLRQMDRAGVARNNRFVLIDISKLTPTPR